MKGIKAERQAARKRRSLQRRKRIKHRLRDRDWEDQPGPMLRGRNIRYEIAERESDEDRAVVVRYPRRQADGLAAGEAHPDETRDRERAVRAHHAAGRELQLVGGDEGEHREEQVAGAPERNRQDVDVREDAMLRLVAPAHDPG